MDSEMNHENAEGNANGGSKGNAAKKRVINACLPCRKKKIKCGREKPVCHNCSRLHNECSWSETVVIQSAPEASSSSHARELFNTYNQSSNLNGKRPAAQGNGEAYSHSPWISDASSKPVLLNHIGYLEQTLRSLQVELEESRSGNSSQQNQVLLSNYASTSSSSQTQPTFSSVSQSAPTFNNASTSHQTPNNSETLSFPFRQDPTPSNIRDVIRQLPRNWIIDFLVEEFEPLERAVLQGLTWRLVRSQLATFANQVSEGQALVNLEEIDLSFLAFLFALLSSSIECCDPQTLISKGIVSDSSNAVRLSDTWQKLSESCLCMTDFLNRPNLNVVSTLLLLSDAFFNRGNLVGMTSLVSLAIRLAQWLGLHKLGTAKDDELEWSTVSKPSNSSTTTLNGNSSSSNSVSKELLKGFPKSNMLSAFSLYTSSKLVPSISDCKSHLIRENARKIWFKLLTYDYYMAADSNGTFTYQVPQQLNGSTGLPLNLDEEDLPDSDAKLPDEKGDGIATHAFGARIYEAVIKGCKKISDLKDLYGRNVASPESIGELDSTFRAIFEQIPIFLRLDGTSERLPEVIKMHEEHRYLTIARLMLYQDLYDRLMMVHQPYLSLGHHDPDYKFSTEACVRSASTVVLIRKELDRIAPAATRYWYFKITLFNSLVMLSLNLIEIARTGKEDEEGLREKIKDGLELLQSSRTIRENYATENNSASRIIDGLLKAEYNRREEKVQQEAFLDMLSADDPLNQYINALIDPQRNSNVTPPDDLFGLLDDLLPKN